MKVVICALHSQYIHSALAPWYLGAGVDTYATQAVEWEVVEGTVNASDDALFAKLDAAAGDVLAFSCYIWNIETVLRLAARWAAAYPDRPVAVGGPEVSFRAAELLREQPAVTYVLAGEGERSFAALVDCLAAGEEPDAVDGLSRRTPTGVVTRPPKRLTEPPPSPYGARYLAALNGRIAYLETSRGCPFSCAFCLSGQDDPVRFFPLDRAERDILTLANAGTRTVKFVDRTFNCHPVRAAHIVRFICDRVADGSIPAGVCFHLEVAADLFDEPLLALLETAPVGLFQIEAGLQSFHADTLAAVSRRTDMDKLCVHLRRLIAAGNLHVHIDLIAGLPRESLACFAESFDRAYALSPHMLQLGFLKLLHGTRLREDAAAHGYIYDARPPYELHSGHDLSEDDRVVLHQTEDALERLYNSGRFPRTLAYLLETTRLRPFELFRTFGAYAAERGHAGMSLDDYTALVLTYFAALPAVEEQQLRNCLICDSLSTRAALLPPCLRQTDSRLKRLKRRFAESGVRHGVALLYAPERVAVATYSIPHPVTGQYPLEILPLPAEDENLLV